MRAEPPWTILPRFAVWLALAAVALGITPGSPHTNPAAPGSLLAVSKLSRVRAVSSSERLPGSLTSAVSERRGRRGRSILSVLPLIPAPGRAVTARVGEPRNTSFGTSCPLRC